MKKRILVLLCFISIGINQTSYAQNQNKIDSLLHVLKSAKEDTNKIIALNTLAWELMQQNPDTSIFFSTQALRLAEKQQWKKGMGESYNQLGWFNYIKGDYALALENSNKALPLWETIKDKKGKAKALSNIGVAYDDQGDYPKALEYYFKSLKIEEELGDKKRIGKILGYIGINYKEQGDYSKALDHYFKALKMAEEMGDKDGIAGTLNNIGTCYNIQGYYSKALDHFLRALKINEQTGNKRWKAINLLNIGNVYYYQGDSAFAKGNKTFAIAEKYPKALDYYFKALKISEELGNKQNIAFLLSGFGSLYTKTGKFKEAEEYLKKAIAMDESIGALNDLRYVEEDLSHLYDTTGQYKMALEYYKKAMVIKDTLFSQEKNEEITRKEMNYEFEKKEAAVKAGQDKKDAIAQQQIQKQKILMYTFIGGLGLVIILLLFGYRVYKTRQVLHLQGIRNKIAADLHDDIGSTLNSISVYSEVARKDDARKDFALKMIGESSRKIIDSLSDIVWSINPENDNFDKITLRMRSLSHNLLKAKKIECTFRADESLSGLKLPMEIRRNFYLIFKEALNNLVKYSQATRASFILTHDEREVNIIIRDDGVGFDALAKHNGNGLNNIRRRANEINARLNIESANGAGTTIELNLTV